MTSHYYKSKILSFADLNEIQQKNVIENYEYEGIEYDDRSYVLEIENSEYPIPLDMFMRINIKNSIWHGYYKKTNTSAYLIKINKSNDIATVAAKYW